MRLARLGVDDAVLPGRDVNRQRTFCISTHSDFVRAVITEQDNPAGIGTVQSQRCGGFGEVNDH